MISNTPWIPSRAKRMNYRHFPDDLRPSHAAGLLAHVGGSTVEIVLPLALLSSTNPTVTLLAVIGMVLFHHHVILSTFPLAVPLEWNVLFAFATVFLFWGYPASDDYGVSDMSSPLPLAVIVGGLVFLPVLVNLRPDLVSFLPSMRQYAGNWASATWAFAPGTEAELDDIVRGAGNTVDQKVIDAALGVIESGSYKVADSVGEQPWLPNGPIPLHVTWTRATADEPVDETDAVVATAAHERSPAGTRAV